jgi:hypothetical protein
MKGWRGKARTLPRLRRAGANTGEGPCATHSNITAGRRCWKTRSEIQSRRVRGLIEAEFTAAGQLNGGTKAPRFFGDLCAADVAGLEESDLVAKVVTHQVKYGAEKTVTGVKLRLAVVSGMHGDLGRREFEDEPTVANVDVGETENVAKKGAVGFRIDAIKKDVSAHNHAASLSIFLEFISGVLAGASGCSLLGRKSLKRRERACSDTHGSVRFRTLRPSELPFKLLFSGEYAWPRFCSIDRLTETNWYVHTFV